MPMRCDAQVFLKHRADMEVLSRYIRQQKKEKAEYETYLRLKEKYADDSEKKI